MATKLFEDIIFGPIKSRRLGSSLGVNLLPVDGKICNFDCIYCECGWTKSGQGGLRYNPANKVISELEDKLLEMSSNDEPLDVITFAGNGEPTMHPNFPEVIDATIALKNKYFPHVKIAVLSNATMIGVEKIKNALQKVDRAILKIDSAVDATIRLIDNPKGRYSLSEIVKCMKTFDGELIIQTMFLRGECEGQLVDNTTEKEVEELIKIYEEINPQQVMIYTIDRDTPLDTLEKVPYEQLEEIGNKILSKGINVSVTK